MSDTLDSSTIKTTHFKGSEDEAGDLTELKDGRWNFGPCFSSSEAAEREKEVGRWVGREGVNSRLRAHKHKVHDKCVGVQK